MIIQKIQFVFFSSLFLLLSFKNIYGQRKAIDEEAYAAWTSLSNPSLSNDGEYVKYDVNYGISNSKRIVVKGVNKKWERVFWNGEVRFINNDKCIINIVNDSLNIYWLGTEKELSAIFSSYYIPTINNEEIIIYQLASGSKDLSIIDLNRGLSRFFNIAGKVIDYVYLPFHDALLLKVEQDSTKGQKALKYLNLKDGKISLVLEAYEINQIIPDSKEAKIVCLIEDSSKQSDVCLINTASLKPEIIERDAYASLNSEISSIIGFAEDSDTILFNMKKKGIASIEALDSLKLNIWSYRDGKIPVKMQEEAPSKVYSYTIRNNSFRPLNIEFKSTESKLDSLKRNYFCESSPSFKFLVYKDKNRKEYFSYELETGITRDITSIIKNNWGLEDGDYDFTAISSAVIGWTADGKSVLIKDEFDIWKVSLTGEYLPVNITNGFGRKNKIRFDLLFFDGSFMAESHIVKDRQRLIFSAFNNRTKENGFFEKKSYNSKGDPVLLIMESAMYWISTTPASYTGIVSSSDVPPQKAKNAEVYLVGKSSSRSSLNFFVTRDFKNFVPITDNHPERKYNWLTTELINWKTDEGINLQGILFKPENFDSTKKYPIIFFYYRKASDNLNTFLLPKECLGCVIDIPSYVSNGYLVFTPDFYFVKGQTGKNALSAVTSAAKVLKKRKYIDEDRMGAQGCSFGGFSTNYIVTHSDIFAAACSASGLSDMISGYNSINDGLIKQRELESGAYQLGSTLWENPSVYFENSAILKADRLNTPLLLMHTTQDPTVPFNNAMEFFLAGKRLNKKIWLLEYQDQYHTLSGKARLDFAIRLRQFFDYYLKDKLPPEWLTVPELLGTDKIGLGLGMDSLNRMP